MISKKDIVDVWVYLRTNNQSFPDDLLDFIKDSAIEKLESLPSSNKSLAERIRIFIDKYAGISPNWDGDDLDGKYTSPDAYELLYVADCLENHLIPSKCFSEWGSGGYKPYSSKEGRKEHDDIMDEVYRIIRKTY